MAVNTTKSLNQKETAIKDLEKQVKEAAAKLNAEKLVKVSIPKAFEKNIGPVLPLGINGVMLVLPVDGKEYEVPAPFKTLLTEYIDNLTS
jgi:hydroxymethylglutaryl-CoA reductase